MPKSSEPFTKPQLPPRRKARQPRVLNYKKCRFCRDIKVKSKCVWDQGQWPNRCKRCSEKGLTCSQPLHKVDEQAEISKSPAFVMSFFHQTENSIFNKTPLPTAYNMPEVGEGFGIHITLQLLSLHSLVLLALEELVSICDVLLRPMKHDTAWYHHSDILSRACVMYEDFAWQLRKHAIDLAPHSKLIMNAALDLNYFYRLSTYTLSNEEARSECRTRVDRLIDAYHDGGHHGMVTTLLMQQFVRFGVDNERVPMFIECRRAFIDSISRLLNENFPRNIATEDMVDIFSGSQLYLPKELLEDTMIRQEYERLELQDCLQRSVELREYDAGFYGVGRLMEKDTSDFTGRTLLHAACSRDDGETVHTLISKGLVHSTKTDSGLTPLHIAAIKSPLCFGKLYEFYSSHVDFNFIVCKMDCCGRTILEWAASCGNARILHILRRYHDFERNQHGLLDCKAELWIPETTFTSAIELSMRHNHSDVFKLLYSHCGNFRATSGRTYIWYAAHYRVLHEMPDLIFDPSMHFADQWGRTPLMEAARLGYMQGIEFFYRYRNFPWMLKILCPKDEDGKTAEILARENGHHSCAELLSRWRVDSGI